MTDGTGRFCGSCGAAQRPPDGCPACGSGGQSGAFCSDCGHRLATPTAVPPLAGTTVERKTTSVLFADLVGFTPLAETRDAEDVRELLSEYFRLTRTIIARYGGTVEKFIGDAVMAVWGVPTTTRTTRSAPSGPGST